MGKSVMSHQRCNMRKLGGLSLQKFLPRRGVEEKVPHGNGRAQRKSGFFHFEDFAAVDFDYSSARFIGSLRLQAKARDRGD